MRRLREIITRSDLYRELGEGSRERVVGLSRLVKASAGQTLFPAGGPCPGVYVVGHGCVRLERHAPNGKVHILRLIREGGSFGEAAVIKGFPAPVDAIAQTETECALLPAESFVALCREDPAFCLEAMASMATRVQLLVTVLEDLILRDAAGRVTRYLCELPPSEGGWRTLPVLKRDLAHHLNLTSETLSRTLRRLVEAGALEMEAERLRLRDQALAEEIALRGLPGGRPS